MKKIPFCKTTFNNKEIKAIEKCFKSGWTVLGPKTEEFEKAFAKYVGAKYAVFVDSGTSALWLSIKAIDYKDFITIPSLTFVSDAEIVYHAGLDIKFADININTFCVDMQYDNLLPVNFSGNLAKGKGKVIDSCHRIEKDDVKGSDALWCYSFYATKNMSTVQGGMIALNDEKIYQWLLLTRDHGMNKGTKQRYQGKNPLYDVVIPGWRVKGDDMRAVIGIEQLKKLPAMNKRRNEIVERYNKNLGLNRTGNHLYPVLANKRSEFIEKLSDNGIQTSIHFVPIHTFTAYKDDKVDLPNTNYIGERICSLPLFPELTNKQVDYISKEVLKTNLLI